MALSKYGVLLQVNHVNIFIFLTMSCSFLLPRSEERGKTEEHGKSKEYRKAKSHGKYE